MQLYQDKKIVVAIPCHNEQLTIQKVILDFKRKIPDAEIVVLDNCSSDHSVKLSREAGAKIIHEDRLGKGWAIRACFENILADVYIMVDGDDTYPAEEVHKLLGPVLKGEADMVVGSRLKNPQDKAFSRFHIFGNHMLTFILNKLFKADFKDILSGYRVFSREFVERVPLITGGFQTETEMTIQAIEKKMSVMEVPINYRPRPKESRSKINTFKDGWLILLTMAMYMRDHNPLRFFLYISLAWIFLGEFLFGSGILFKISGFQGGIIQGVIFLGALILFVGGMVMSAVNTRFKELDVTLRKLIKRHPIMRNDKDV